jgi:tRNA-dihydrouridine synthase
MNDLYIAFAPLQGYTDAVYRRAHWECVGGVDEYYTPFVRIEKGEIRKKDLRDTDPAANEGVPMVPQVWCSSTVSTPPTSTSTRWNSVLASHSPQKTI